MANSISDEKAKDGIHVQLTQDDSPQGIRSIEYKKREAALVRKMDCFIAPVMMLLMLISYLDRGNIGFAATQGMAKDIHLVGSQLNTAIPIFYIFYILAEVASALSGAFGGLLAYAILFMNGTAGVPGWRWLYVLEGIITVVWAGLCCFLVPRSFETAYFLNEDDKVIMRHRAVLTESYSGGKGHYKWKDIKMAARDVKSWVYGVIQICVVTILYGFGTFLPIILKDGFHFSTIQAQYLVIPVNLWGAIVYAVGAVLSDKYKIRFLSLIICSPFGIAGYAILLAPVPAGVEYFATYLISTACYLCTGTNIAWLSGNCTSDGKRVASVGILLSLTNIGGIVAGQIYQTKSAPKFILGHSWSLGCLTFVWCGWWVVRWIYKRREAEKDGAEGEQLVLQEEWSDRAPNFRYQF